MSIRTQRPAFLEDTLPDGVTKHPAEGVEIYVWDRFLLPTECRRLIGEAGDKVTPSTTTIKALQGLRTSKTGLLYPLAGQVSGKLETKIMQATGFDLLCSDMLQVQVYEKGGQYQDHFDFFAKEMPGFDRAIADGGQRTWTFMIYLNTVKEGGGTRFPAIDHTFTAKAGRALFWNNLNPDGTLNPLTIHAGLPVKKGKKVIATKWFREAPTWAMLQRFQGYAAG